MIRGTSDLTTFKRCIDDATGRNAVIDIARAGAAYVEDARGGCGHAAAFVAPRSTEEVSLVLRTAAECRIRLIPQGANTGLVAAGVPEDATADVVLSLRAMNRRPSIDVANRTATHYRRFTGSAALRLSAAIQRARAPARIGRVDFGG